MLFLFVHFISVTPSSMLQVDYSVPSKILILDNDGSLHLHMGLAKVMKFALGNRLHARVRNERDRSLKKMKLLS